MTIDAHQHFWNYDPVKDVWITEEMKAIRKSFKPKDLKLELDAHGMDGSVVVQAAPTDEETTFLLEMAEQNDFIKGVVGWIDFTNKEIEDQLRAYRKTSTKLKGFRHLVQDEPDNWYLLKENFCRGISCLSTYDYTYDILIYPKQLPAALKFVSYFPEQKFVIDHLAKPLIKEDKIEPWATQIKEMAQHPKVYCKLSGIITEADWYHWREEEIKPYLEVVFDAFGPERLMFGSDWPVCLVAGTYTKVKGLITDFIKTLSQKDQQAVMGNTAVDFYQL